MDVFHVLRKNVDNSGREMKAIGLFWPRDEDPAVDGDSEHDELKALDYNEENQEDFYFKMKEDRECVVCGIIYKECDNIGKWNCRYHPGKESWFDYNNRELNELTCCRSPIVPFSNDVARDIPKKNKFLNSGCILMDHTIKCRPYTISDDLSIPVLLGNFLGCSPHSKSVFVHEDSSMRVRRFDYGAVEKVMNSSMETPISSFIDFESKKFSDTFVDLIRNQMLQQRLQLDGIEMDNDELESNLIEYCELFRKELIAKFFTKIQSNEIQNGMSDDDD